MIEDDSSSISGLALVGGSLLPNVFVKMANAATTKGSKRSWRYFSACRRRADMIVRMASGLLAARPTIAVPRRRRGRRDRLDGFFAFIHRSIL